jgi:hypothetical protein
MIRNQMGCTIDYKMVAVACDVLYYTIHGNFLIQEIELLGCSSGLTQKMEAVCSPPKSWYTTRRPHGTTAQKTAI